LTFDPCCKKGPGSVSCRLGARAPRTQPDTCLQQPCKGLALRSRPSALRQFLLVRSRGAIERECPWLRLSVVTDHPCLKWYKQDWLADRSGQSSSRHPVQVDASGECYPTATVSSSSSQSLALQTPDRNGLRLLRQRLMQIQHGGSNGLSRLRRCVWTGGIVLEY